MKIGVIGMFHETNSFAPGTTERHHFAGEWVSGTEAYRERYEKTRTSMGGVIDGVKQLQAELIAGTHVAATPSGMVTTECFEELAEQVVRSVPAGIDGLIVVLHGAMVAQDCRDVEGELLRRIRDKTGRELPVAITLDLHANISPQMVDLADVIIGYDTYPHIDAYERAVEAALLLGRMLHSEVKPMHSYRHSRLLVAPQAMVTHGGFMKEIMETAFELEQQAGVLNITVAGGFPYSDVEDAGMAFVVTTDNDPALAEQCAEKLVRLVRERREEFAVAGCSAKESVEQALRLKTAGGPVILIEGSDNVGGGAPGDATHLLQHLVGAPATSLMVIRDGDAVSQAIAAGVGGTFTGRVGGKADAFHGDPVPIEGKVRLLFDGQYRHIGPYMTGQWADMGRTAVIETGSVTVILTEKRVAPWDPGHVASLGLNPADFDLIAVKSAVAWQTAFGSCAVGTVQVDTPGCCGFNLSHFTYRHLKRPIYPLDWEI
ncbi:M81 family metallopeptidase [Paenibacillus sp. J2TS4]|uniref:M81 family metallopeptidase n=1 Tax=Paenibacillus sp. J2TS4 TaxID=2807194 RepID=UPI001B0D5478|nr:M81 family metallopeptidase [Paenibacillus sp. J2TS4]GIP34991.1 microcystinase C [Paenibacillus sp. J2TS4]